MQKNARTPRRAPVSPRGQSLAKEPELPRRTQAERRTSAEAKLLSTAREIVARKGWVGMTLAEVGEAAGYSRGLAAHHFGSKPQLLRALAAHINKNFMEGFGKSQSVQGLNGLLDFIRYYLGRSDPKWTNTRALLALMSEAMTDTSETGQSLATYNESVLEFLAGHISAGIANKEIRSDINPTSAATVILGALRGIMLQKLLKDSSVDLAAVRKEFLSMVVNSYAARPTKWNNLIAEKAPAKSPRQR